MASWSAPEAEDAWAGSLDDVCAATELDAARWLLEQLLTAPAADQEPDHQPEQ